MRKVYKDVMGLIPAAGRATRLGSLPCSKEIYPLGLQKPDENGIARPKVACQYLLERFHLAGITRAFVIIRPGKWDIPAYLGDGQKFDMHLGYLIMGHPYGSPYSIDQAWPFIQNNRVALGYPDTIIEPKNAYSRLLARQDETGADVVLGLLPADKPHKTDMVETDPLGRVRKIIIKPEQTDLRFCWAIAVWTSRFSDFLHHFLARVIDQAKQEGNLKKLAEQEFYVGNVLQAWLQEGPAVETEIFPEGRWLDIGTPDDLYRGLKHFGLD